MCFESGGRWGKVTVTYILWETKGYTDEDPIEDKQTGEGWRRRLGGNA